MLENLPLVSGLIGALIGAGASVATQIIQARNQNKRERTKLIVEMAIHDQKHHMTIAGQMQGKRVAIMPLGAYAHYHAALLTLLEKDALTPESLIALRKESSDIMDAIESLPPRK